MQKLHMSAHEACQLAACLLHTPRSTTKILLRTPTESSKAMFYRSSTSAHTADPWGRGSLHRMSNPTPWNDSLAQPPATRAPRKPDILGKASDAQRTCRDHKLKMHTAKSQHEEQTSM